MKDNVIAVFGDSIAWGANDSEHGGWVEMLKNFAAKKTDYWTAVYNLGVSGDGVDDLLKRMAPEAEARSPDTVIIAIGANEARYVKKPENPAMTSERFREGMRSLAVLAKGLARNIVFVGVLPFDESRTMPISWVPDFYHTNELAKRNNDIIREECKKSKVPFIDLFSEWMKVDYKKMLGDGVHPTTEGHRKIFKTVSAFLIKSKLL